LERSWSQAGGALEAAHMHRLIRAYCKVSHQARKGA
jgi:hypothetical protein